MKLYSLKDLKAGTFGAIMMAPTDGVMCRTLDEMTPPEHTVRRFSGDYQLFEVGEFDDKTGEVTESNVRFVVDMAVIFEPPVRR